MAQFNLGQTQNSDRGRITNFSVLPASHLLLNDTSQYLSESKLVISKLDLSFNNARNQLLIENYTLYSATSFQPHDPLTGGLSGKLQIGYETYRNFDYQYERDAIAEAALGKTYRWHQDFDWYYLAGGKAIFDRQLKFSPYLQAGGILRAIFKMKSHFFLNKQFTIKDQSRDILTYNFEHIFNFNNFAFVIFTKKEENKGFWAEEHGINFRKYF